MKNNKRGFRVAAAILVTLLLFSAVGFVRSDLSLTDFLLGKTHRVQLLSVSTFDGLGPTRATFQDASGQSFTVLTAQHLKIGKQYGIRQTCVGVGTKFGGCNYHIRNL